MAAETTPPPEAVIISNVSTLHHKARQVWIDMDDMDFDHQELTEAWAVARNTLDEGVQAIDNLLAELIDRQAI